MHELWACNCEAQRGLSVVVVDNSSSQKETLQRRIADLETEATKLEEQAEFAAQEAQLRKRIATARKKIADNTPPDLLDNILGNLKIRLPQNGGIRFLLVVGVIVTVVLLLAKGCGNG